MLQITILLDNSAIILLSPQRVFNPFLFQNLFVRTTLPKAWGQYFKRFPKTHSRDARELGYWKDFK